MTLQKNISICSVFYCIATSIIYKNTIRNEGYGNQRKGPIKENLKSFKEIGEHDVFTKHPTVRTRTTFKFSNDIVVLFFTLYFQGTVTVFNLKVLFLAIIMC